MRAPSGKAQNVADIATFAAMTGVLGSANLSGLLPLASAPEVARRRPLQPTAPWRIARCEHRSRPNDRGTRTGMQSTTNQAALPLQTAQRARHARTRSNLLDNTAVARTSAAGRSLVHWHSCASIPGSPAQPGFWQRILQQRVSQASRIPSEMSKSTPHLNPLTAPLGGRRTCTLEPAHVKRAFACLLSFMGIRMQQEIHINRVAAQGKSSFAQLPLPSSQVLRTMARRPWEISIRHRVIALAMLRCR